MKRDEHVNDMPDIEIIDLENETVQDTDFGKSDISDDFEGNPDDEYVYQVWRPTMPSAVRLNCFWNARTVAAIRLPNTPSTVSLPRKG